jgi:DNA-binding transcriptional regulator YiaG
LIDDVDDDPADTSGAGTCSSASGATGAAAEDLVAAEIRRRREAAGVSQRALAKRAGFSRQYVSRAENPAQGLPSENLIAVLDTALDADGALVDLWLPGLHDRTVAIVIAVCSLAVTFDGYDLVVYGTTIPSLL